MTICDLCHQEKPCECIDPKGPQQRMPVPMIHEEPQEPSLLSFRAQHPEDFDEGYLFGRKLLDDTRKEALREGVQGSWTPISAALPKVNLHVLVRDLDDGVHVAHLYVVGPTEYGFWLESTREHMGVPNAVEWTPIPPKGTKLRCRGCGCQNSFESV